MLVSVIVTTKNEERNIETCLKSVTLQTYKKIEIIVVDNFSTDKTREIALKYTDKVYSKGPERSAQRNFGMIDIAKGKYVMFVDADMILSPCLVESCVKEMEEDYQSSNLQPLISNLKPMTVALHIPEIVLGKKYFSKVRRFERSFYNGTVIDGARFFLKEAFIKVGGFDEGMSGPEDWDIDKKIKQIGKIGLLDNVGVDCNPPNWELYGFIKERGVNPKDYGTVIYHNEDEFNIKKYLQKKTYYAGSFNTYINKWGQNDPEIRKQFGAFYRFFWVFFENGKWKKLISHPFLTLGMYYLRFMLGIKFFMYKSK
jgi:glycosyltransferase involved in cell wall biosynthesis